MRDDKGNLIVDLTFDFALTIISFCEDLEKARKYNLANQLFRSGTSIGANTWESQNAESKADFILPNLQIFKSSNRIRITLS